MKRQGVRPPKVAVDSRQTQGMIQLAMQQDNLEMAAMMSVARLFLLRVPSECVPLQWRGLHSSVEVDGEKAIITLSSRKNSRVPVVLTRTCVCRTSGPKLCAVHWLLRMRSRPQPSNGNIFTTSSSQFASKIKEYSVELNFPMGMRMSSHAFRRGMAQEIIDHGGSLAVLLRAGDWSSSAFLSYLRHSQPEDAAAAQTIIMMSDSEAEK